MYAIFFFFFFLLFLFFFNDTATTEIYTLSLHDALPIYLFIIACSVEKLLFSILLTVCCDACFSIAFIISGRFVFVPIFISIQIFLSLGSGIIFRSPCRDSSLLSAKNLSVLLSLFTRVCLLMYHWLWRYKTTAHKSSLCWKFLEWRLLEVRLSGCVTALVFFRVYNKVYYF